jgi:hypothetical protein
VRWEQLLDQAASGVGQRDVDDTPVAGATRARDESTTFEVVEDRHHVRPAAEQLAGDLGLRHFPEMEQRFEHAELSGREAGRGGMACQLTRQRVGGPHQLDVGIQRQPLARCAAEVCAHGFSSYDVKSFDIA